METNSGPKQLSLPNINSVPLPPPIAREGDAYDGIVKLSFDDGFVPTPGEAIDFSKVRMQYRNDKGQFVSKDIIDKIIDGKTKLEEKYRTTSQQFAEIDQVEDVIEEPLGFASADELDEARREADAEFVALNRKKDEGEKLSKEELADQKILAKMIINLKDQADELRGLSKEERAANTDRVAFWLAENGLELDIETETDANLLSGAIDYCYWRLHSDTELVGSERRQLENYAIKLNRRIHMLDGVTDENELNSETEKMVNYLEKLRDRTVDITNVSSLPNNLELIWADDLAERVEYDKARKTVNELLAKYFGIDPNSKGSLFKEEYEKLAPQVHLIGDNRLQAEQKILEANCAESAAEVNDLVMTYRSHAAKATLRQIYELRQQMLLDEGASEDGLQKLDTDITKLSALVAEYLGKTVQYDTEGYIVPDSDVETDAILDFVSEPEKKRNRKGLWLTGAAAASLLIAGLLGGSESSDNQFAGNDVVVTTTISEKEAPTTTISTETDSANDQAGNEHIDGSSEAGESESNTDEMQTDTAPEEAVADSEIIAYKPLNVPEGEGFENSIQQQYGLDDFHSFQAYKAIEPFVKGATGTYLGPQGDVRISSPGSFILPDPAAQALLDYIHTLEDKELPDAA